MHVLQQSFWRHLLSKYFMRYFKTSLRSIYEEKRNDFNVLCTIKIFMWLSLWTLILWLWGVNKAFFFKVRPVIFFNQKFLALTQSFSFFFRQTFLVLTQSFPFFYCFLFLFCFLSCFELGLPCFDSALLVLLSRTFSILTQSFPFIESVLLFLESVLPGLQAVLLIFWITLCQFLKSNFSRESFLFGLQAYRVLMISVRDGFESVLPLFFTASFPLFSIMRSDLIEMCTVNKIENGGNCRKRLLHYHERKRIEIVLLEKLVTKLLRNKQVREKNKIKWQLHLLTLLY